LDHQHGSRMDVVSSNDESSSESSEEDSNSSKGRLNCKSLEDVGISKDGKQRSVFNIGAHDHQQRGSSMDVDNSSNEESSSESSEESSSDSSEEDSDSSKGRPKKKQRIQ
jgi:hypothetical protein